MHVEKLHLPQGLAIKGVSLVKGMKQMMKDLKNEAPRHFLQLKAMVQRHVQNKYKSICGKICLI